MTSYPSGHVGASTALYLCFTLLALRIERVACAGPYTASASTAPLLVAFARLYRGMHHVSDVAAGVVVGVACALLAYGWYRHRAGATAAVPPRRQPSEPGPPRK